MNISKFFRRYSRILLMVFMSLLLVVFLVGDVLQNAASQRANPKLKIGEAFGKDIYTTDIQQAAIKQSLLQQLNFRDIRLLESPIDVYLLIEEARRMGIHIGHDQVKAMLTALRVTPAWLAGIQQNTGRSYESIYNVAAEWLAVLQLVVVQQDALDDSLPRAELAYRGERESADVLLSVLDSRAFLQTVPEPTEEELQAFFEETKARQQEHTEEELVFGYRLPNRVRLEYLTVDPKTIESRMRPRPRELQAFYEDYRNFYTKTVRPDTQSTQPDNLPTQVQMTFEEARDTVRRDCRVDKAIREAQSAVNEIRHAAYLPWQSMKRDDKGFREAPPIDTISSFEELRDRFSEQRYPVTYGHTELLNEEEILQTFDTRSEFLRQRMGSLEPMYFEGQRQLPVSQLALRVKGLFMPEADDFLPTLSLLEPSPVLINMDYNRGTRQSGPYQAYVVRVSEIAPEGPPAALDDVRARLVEDYKLLKAHEIAAEHARKLGERAQQVGLLTAIDEAVGVKALLEEADQNYQPKPTPPGQPPEMRPQYANDFEPSVPAGEFTRNSTSVMRVGPTQKVQRDTFKLAQTSADAGTYRIAVVPVANLNKWVLVQLDGVQPMYADEFETVRPQLLQSFSDQDRAALKWIWIIPENVRARTGFKPVEREQPAETAAEDSSDES
ncbi:MAG: hypothetical protein ABIG44_19335 [Planctomycetota bacterium]